jgi:ribonucleoside-diphosphate reductase alpha chain
MEVIKRDGRREKVSFDKITLRISGLCKKLKLTRVDPIQIAQETIQGIHNGITTEELDIFASNKCAEKIMDDTEYNKLAAGLCISNIHKTTSENFLEVTNKLYNNVDRFGNHNPLVTKEYVKNVKNNITKINKMIDYERDYNFDFFSIKTMEKAYLIRILNKKKENYLENKTKSKKEQDKDKERNIQKEIMMMRKFGRVVERPQHMIMRVAIGIWGSNIENAFRVYDRMSNRYFTHASPTLYNAGSPYNQLSSCFLLNIDDSIDGIFETVADVAKISKRAGGIGIAVTNIRSRGSLIRGTNGNSDGIIPLAKLFNQEARYVNQGGRRKGAVALYLEPWHSDIYDFCNLRKNTGTEELRARDIFLGLWINDLFMKRVLAGENWTLMCPDECPNLTTTFGEEFEKLYIQYEKEGRGKKIVKAEDLLFHIMESQMETGMPYMCYKDNVNNKSNQKNIGVIQCSNLCSEIVEYTSLDEISVCNLASLCLPRYIEKSLNGIKTFNFKELYEDAKLVTKSLNKIIDINYYPVDKARYSNFKHRPIGVGVQGLADVYCIMELPFDSDKAFELNKRIFETIYFGCCESSMELAKIDGPYETFQGSPFSKGILQWHMWGLTENDLLMDWNWSQLIENIKKYGMRNSLLTSLMPTASTSQLMGNCEAIEPFVSNLYTRKTLAGEFIVVNKYLIDMLIEKGLYTNEVKEELLYDNGSIQKIEEIPQYIKEIFKTAFEMKTKPLIDQAVSRGPFIDQSQSLNIFSEKPSFNMLRMTHIYGWKKGLKTGMYYLRSRTAVDPFSFGLDYDSIIRIKKKRKETDNIEKYKHQNKNSKSDEIVDNRNDNYSECEMCSG